MTINIWRENEIELEGGIMKSAEAVTRVIEQLTKARDTVWPPPKKPEKKK